MFVDPTYSGDYFEYHVYDKLVDHYTSAFVMFYLITFNVVSPVFFTFFFVFFVLRLIGILLFINTNQTKYLKMFPDAVREFMIFALIVPFLPLNWQSFIYNNVQYFAILTYALKALFECYFHQEPSKKVFAQKTE